MSLLFLSAGRSSSPSKRTVVVVFCLPLETHSEKDSLLARTSLGVWCLFDQILLGRGAGCTYLSPTKTWGFVEILCAPRLFPLPVISKELTQPKGEKSRKNSLKESFKSQEKGARYRRKDQETRRQERSSTKFRTSEFGGCARLPCA
jgi:hypothetical protein